MAPAEVQQQRRSNKRGLATREAMLDAAVRSLASGDPGAVSASRIAKESGATWGAVQYQFGDVDGFWAAVLHRTAEKRDATMAAFTSAEPEAPLRERVAAIIDTLYHGLASQDSRAIENLRAALPVSPTNWSGCFRARRPSCSRGARVGRRPVSAPSPAWASTRSACGRWRR